MDAFAHRPSERAAAGRRIIRIPQAANRFLQSAASPTDRSRNSGGGVPASRAGFAAAGGVGGIALKTRRIQRTDIVSSCGTTRSVSDTLIGPPFDCGSWVRTTRTTRSTVGVTWRAPRRYLGRILICGCWRSGGTPSRPPRHAGGAPRSRAVTAAGENTRATDGLFPSL